MAYQEFLRANGINPEDLSQKEYSDIINTQEMYNDDLIHFSNSENCKEVRHTHPGQTTGCHTAMAPATTHAGPLHTRAPPTPPPQCPGAARLKGPHANPHPHGRMKRSPECTFVPAFGAEHLCVK